MKNNKSFRSYLYEFLVLFVAVFMGFLAENFRENLSERKKEQFLLRSFLNDISGDVNNIDRVITKNEDQRLLMEEFLGIRELDFKIDSNQIRFVESLAPIGMWSPFIYEPSRASLNQLQSTGMMSSLKANIAAATEDQTFCGG